jgi:hypothetical protein
MDYKGLEKLNNELAVNQSEYSHDYLVSVGDGFQMIEDKSGFWLHDLRGMDAVTYGPFDSLEELNEETKDID